MTEAETPTQMFNHLLPGLASQIQKTPTPMQQPHLDRDPRKRPRTRRGNRASRSNNEEELQQTVSLLTALVLQHEDVHNRVRLSASMTFFLQQQGPGSVLLPLFKVSQEWQKNRNAGQVAGALRTTILSVLIQETAARLTMLESNPQALASAKQAGILTTENKMPYQKWSAANKKLEPDATLQPLSPEEVRNLLTEVKELIRPDLVTRFHASRPLRQEPQDQGRAVFTLELALRSEEADRMHSKLKTLCNRSVWGLVCAQLREPTLQRHGLAAALQKTTNRGTGRALRAGTSSDAALRTEVIPAI